MKPEYLDDDDVLFYTQCKKNFKLMLHSIYFAENFHEEVMDLMADQFGEDLNPMQRKYVRDCIASMPSECWREYSSLKEAWDKNVAFGLELYEDYQKRGTT